MSEAPERIWLTEDLDLIAEGLEQPDNGRDVQYLRADLVPDWQPIETAPDDGTEVELGRVGCGDIHRGIWARGRWRDPIFDDPLFWCGDPEPTHWQPLPAPPSPRPRREH